MWPLSVIVKSGGDFTRAADEYRNHGLFLLIGHLQMKKAMEQ